MAANFDELIELFRLEGEKVVGVYDLLLRGSGSNEARKKLIHGWSDLDFSVIVDEINPVARTQVRGIYRALRARCNIKITITLVCLEDYLSQYHSHGNRPFYYSFLLENARSLLHGEVDVRKEPFVFNKKIKENCIANIVYLMHDLRDGYTKCGDSIEELGCYYRHLVKRAGHFFRNAIFIQTGKITLILNKENLLTVFPDASQELPLQLDMVRASWNSLSEDKKRIEDGIHFVLDGLEYVYNKVINANQFSF